MQGALEGVVVGACGAVGEGDTPQSGVRGSAAGGGTLWRQQSVSSSVLAAGGAAAGRGAGSGVQWSRAGASDEMPLLDDVS